MFFVFPDQFIWVKKHFCCGFEVDTVFCKVDPVFFLISFERCILQVNINTIIHNRSFHQQYTSAKHKKQHITQYITAQSILSLHR